MTENGNRPVTAKPIEEVLSCVGYNGFGGGYVFGRENVTTEGMKALEPQDNYCHSKCPKRVECWAKHQTRAKLMYPKGTMNFDKMVKKLGQAQAMIEFEKRYKSFDPYTLNMISNLQDGLAVARTGKPYPKGPYTLPWPFPGAKADA